MSGRNLALIGAGYWGKNLARNFRDLGALHTLCDVNQSILDTYGEEYRGIGKTSNLADIWRTSEVTRVAIAAPAAQHYAVAKAALLAGKDVFVEKPLCLGIAEAKELIEIANAGNRILMVGHLLQYHPHVQHLRTLVDAGEFGELHYIMSTRLNLGKIRREENALWSFAPHDLSVILGLVGDNMPVRVRCTGGAYLNHAVSDTTLTVLEFAGNIRGHVHVSWLNPFKEQKLTIVGSKGMAVFDDTRPWNEKLLIYKDYLTRDASENPVPTKTPARLVSIPEAEPLRNECLHFITCCDSRSAPRTDGHEGLRVLRLLQAAQSSLDHDGRPTTPLQ